MILHAKISGWQKGHDAGVQVRCSLHVFMAARHSRRGHYILQLWFLLSSFFFFFFLGYSQRSEIGCLPYLHTWCGLSVNLQCRSKMCCTRLAENTGRKNYTKNRHLHTITQLCRAISSQLRHISTIGKNTEHINKMSAGHLQQVNMFMYMFTYF